MSIDTTSKFICEICGGSHPTTEHDVLTQPKSLSNHEETTTNVAPEDLNYDRYESEIYDEDIRRSIPGYDAMHQKIDDVVREYVADNKVNKILDLGIGTGLTAERLLKITPNASITGVDFSEQMMKGAKKRLVDAKVDFVFGDYSKIDLEAGFTQVDVVFEYVNTALIIAKK